MDIEALQRFVELDRKKKHLKSELKSIEDQLKELKGPILEDFSATGIQNIHINGSTVYLARELWASVKGGCHDELAEVIREFYPEYRYLTDTRINGNSLSEIVREFDQNGKSLPETWEPLINVNEVFKIKAIKGN